MVKINKFKYKLSNWQLYNLCVIQKIPIIRKKTAKFIFNWISKYNYKTMLEIGTAYGFSANLFSKINCLNIIDTIEYNYENYNIALSFCNSSKISFFNVNAFQYDNDKKYDVIFLDGPKSNQEILLLKFIKKLNKNGVIFIDNLYLKKFDSISIEKLSKNKLKLISKIEKFNNFLRSSNDFVFKEICLDDGLGMVCNKNDEKWFKEQFKE